MSSAAAAAAARRDKEYTEYGATTAIATLNPLLDEAVGAAYAKGGTAAVTRDTGSQGPRSVSVDRNGDGKTDTTLHFERTFWDNVETIKAGERGKCQATRSLGKVQDLQCDFNGDGKNDMKITVNRSVWSGLTSLDVDTNGDGKPDHKLTPDTNFWGTVKGMHVDIGANGTNDGYVEFVRNGWGNIDKLVFKKKP